MADNNEKYDRLDAMVVKRVVEELMLKAESKLPDDIIEALTNAYNRETETIPKSILKNIVDNFTLSGKSRMPMCQDTGFPIYYVTIGQVNLPVSELYKGIIEGTVSATSRVPLRPNAVHPLSRKNNGDNTGEGSPSIHMEYKNIDYIEITAFPKGAGSENMTALYMLNPSDGVKGIRKSVLETVKRAGGKPCPPIIVGLGIGGTADVAISLAKRSLLRPITKRHAEKDIAELETSLLEEVNALHVGPMGLGGVTTALAVNAEYSYCHTASLPVAVNIQCWAARRATGRIYSDGHVEYVG